MSICRPVVGLCASHSFHMRPMPSWDREQGGLAMGGREGWRSQTAGRSGAGASASGGGARGVVQGGEGAEH